MVIKINQKIMMTKKIYTNVSRGLVKTLTSTHQKYSCIYKATKKMYNITDYWYGAEKFYNNSSSGRPIAKLNKIYC